ncbi:MAG: hypothetical protein KA270_17390 [Saprospiraceae bacterium]|nr:hypothetical protein [Saprospiraceae bacterium]MBP6568953.1 hypothetical protein [Saprospiraceae bacterium]
MATTREEQLKWCKERALEYAKNGDLTNAFASFQSDMRKHPETNVHMALRMGITLLFGGHLSTEKEMTDWIEGFN